MYHHRESTTYVIVAHSVVLVHGPAKCDRNRNSVYSTKVATTSSRSKMEDPNEVGTSL